jgi:hypothetical protein
MLEADRRSLLGTAAIAAVAPASPTLAGDAPTGSGGLPYSPPTGHYRADAHAHAHAHNATSSLPEGPVGAACPPTSGMIQQGPGSA